MDSFEIFAESSIPLADFGATHAALRGTTIARGDYRAGSVVSSGCLAFLLSIFPLLLALASLSNEAAWWIASGFGVVGPVLVLVLASFVLPLDFALGGDDTERPSKPSSTDRDPDLPRHGGSD